MTIYVVTSGEYSDYHIESVFADKKQAELYCAVRDSRREAYDSDFCRIEEYETDEAQLEGKVYYGISFYAQVYTSGIYLQSADQIYSISPVVTKSKSDRSALYRYITGTISTSQAYDWEQRRKIAQDYLAKMQAEEKGL